MSEMNPLRRKSADLRVVDDRAEIEPNTLLVRAGRGDEEAFASLYDVVAPMVFGIVRRVIRDQALSEEVTQEVFVELWRTAPRFDAGRGSAQAWVATLAHRRAVDRVRSEQSRRDREQRDADSTPTASADASEAVIDQLDRARVREALSLLSAGQREAIELAYYGGRTYREVAVLLDTAEGTIKTRIRDGLIKLRDHLEVTT